VQITALGYPATTGLPAIDYRLTDATADPAGQEAVHSERLLRLPGCFLCYLPPEPASASAPGPVINNGFVTFGSFNNLVKINAGVVALWSKLLQSVPGSRLLIKNPSLSDRATADLYAGLFQQHGIASERVTLLGLTPTLEQHLNTYRLIDIALDTFPYNGTTTTCEALYMGVPVITLAGRSHAGRVGASLLTTLGMDELIAATPEDYLARAGALAQDTDRLSGLRETLRERLRASPLCDGAAYARKIERTYREAWRTWCERQAKLQHA
jgi:predicted O-linked N-acetylglucosamine transferase (SPINDLY family)